MIEDSIQLQSEIHCLEKDRDKIQFERDEFDKNLRQLSGSYEENLSLKQETVAQAEAVRRLEQMVDKLQVEKN